MRWVYPGALIGTAIGGIGGALGALYPYYKAKSNAPENLRALKEGLNRTHLERLNEWAIIASSLGGWGAKEFDSHRGDALFKPSLGMKHGLISGLLSGGYPGLYSWLSGYGYAKRLNELAKKSYVPPIYPAAEGVEFSVGLGRNDYNEWYKPRLDRAMRYY